MTLGGDSRAVSTTVSYTLTLVITTLLVTGLLIAGGDFVADQRDSATRSELRVIGQQLAADVNAADRLGRTTSEDGDLEIERRLPDRVAGSAYRVGVRQVGSSDTYAFTLSTENPDIATETRVYSTVPVFTKQNLTGGTAAVSYNSVTEEVLVRDPGPYVFQADGGDVAIEAETYPENQPGTGEWSGHYWRTFEDIDASGGQAVVARPNWSSGGGTGDDTTGPRLDYEIDFETGGDYYVYVRMNEPADSGNSDSIHVSLEDTTDPLPTYGGDGLSEGTDPDDDFEWVHGLASDGVSDDYVQVSAGTGGRKTLHIWMREDGTQVDKIVLSKNKKTTAQLDGAPESEWG